MDRDRVEQPAAAGSDLNRAFFEDAYRRYGKIVFLRCRMILHSEHEARDAVQDVFIKLIYRRAQLDDARALLPWLLEVTTNHCIDLLRRRRPTSSYDELSDQLGAVESPSYEQRQLLQTLLGGLDAQTQAIVIYAYLDGFSHAQIGELCHLSEKTVSRRLKRFKKQADAFVARQRAQR